MQNEGAESHSGHFVNMKGLFAKKKNKKLNISLKRHTDKFSGVLVKA